MNLYLILLSTFISVCLCSPAIQSRPVSQYDVGCYAARERALRLHLFYPHFNVPSCVDGGLWRHYQCTLGGPCYCVFVDTGNSFPLFSYSSPIFHRFFAFAHFTAKACPVRKQKVTSSGDCRNPPLNYPCNLNKAKYAFNRNTQTCEKTYSCYGYNNRSDCEATCGVQVYGSCNFPLDVGKFCERRLAGTRYRHDPSTGECQSFSYRGCGGNSNNYANIWDCQQACVPQVNVTALVRVSGSITYNVSLPLWAVERFRLSLNGTTDIDDNTFTEIAGNVFEFAVIVDDDHDDSRSLNILGSNSKRKPQEKKLRDIFPSHIICSRPAITGVCRGYFPRWYYDEDRQKCFKFVYGGCQTNGNNFEKAHECTSYCQARYTPSPLELVAPPTDSSGRAIPNPRGKATKCVKNQRGEVICLIPGTTTPATTPYAVENDDDDNEDEESADN